MQSSNLNFRMKQMQQAFVYYLDMDKIRKK